MAILNPTTHENLSATLRQEVWSFSHGGLSERLAEQASFMKWKR